MNIENQNLTVLITGGSGFLGKAIVNEFLDKNSILKTKEIRILDIEDYKGIQDEKIQFIKCDIRDYQTIVKATKNVDVVIHAAAIIDWGIKSEAEVIEINTGGTENIINACFQNNVKCMIYTSSLDAVYTGKSLRNVDESLEYPKDFKTSYCKSKCLSEKLVVKASKNELKTCILRPSDIFGEGDPYHIDPLINMAKNGFYVRLGNGKSKCQHIYVRNMAHAHLLAIKNLLFGNEKALGQVYFITDGPGVNFFTFFDKIIEGAGYKIFPKNLWLPKWFSLPIAAVVEFFAFMIKPIVKTNPQFSRFAVNYTCNDFTFNSDKAKNDFGFYLKYSKTQALQSTIDYYTKLKK